jgi:hypothetical protein
LGALVLVAIGFALGAAQEEVAAGNGDHLEREVRAGDGFDVGNHEAGVDFDGGTFGGFLADDAAQR